MAFLLLIHIVLGAGLVLARGLAPAERARAVTWAGGAGALSALALFVVRGSEATWGTLVMNEGRAAGAGAAIFCAWLLVVATEDGRGRWELGALVGAGSAALIGFSLNEWIAPALLFWVCLSAATGVAVRSAGQGRWAPVLIGLSDVLVVGALVGWAVQEQTWRLPDALEGWPMAVAVVGSVLRAGVLPRIGAWELASSGTVAFIPLLIGSVFTLAPTISGGDEIAVALPLLAAGMGAALWCAIRSPQVVLAAGWMVATMLAVVFIAPASLGKAASAACLGATAALVWPWTGGRAGPERGLLLALVPLTVGFGPVVGGAVATFGRSARADTVLAAAPWAAFAALLPAALAVAVTMGAAVVRRVEPETYRPVAVLATWAIAGLALLLGLTGGAELGLSLSGELWLYVAAAACGAAGARFAPRQAIRHEVVETGPALGVFALPRRIERIAAPASLALLAGSLATAVAFTYIGLRNGFL